MVIETFRPFSMTTEYLHALSVSLNEKNQIPKIWTFFWHIFYENWIFWISIFLHFFIYFCSQAQYLSLQYLIFCVWMLVFHWISSCIDKVKTKSTVAQRISPIFFVTYFSLNRLCSVLKLSFYSQPKKIHLLPSVWREI